MRLCMCDAFTIFTPFATVKTVKKRKNSWNVVIVVNTKGFGANNDIDFDSFRVRVSQFLLAPDLNMICSCNACVQCAHLVLFWVLHKGCCLRF